MTQYEESLPGDELIADAALMVDRRATLSATPEEIWPWLAQLGRGRAGWYLSRRMERFTPRSNRALRVIDPAFEQVAVGDRVSEQGPDGWFEARIVDPPHALVWWLERPDELRTTWALLVAPRGPDASEFHVRLRANRRLGASAPTLVERGAEMFDRFTIAIMIAGLRERLADARAAQGLAGAPSERFAES